MKYIKNPKCIDAIQFTRETVENIRQFSQNKIEIKIPRSIDGIATGTVLKDDGNRIIVTEGDYLVKDNGIYFRVEKYKFERDYVLVEKESIMNFGQALENVKRGKRIARKGWNGKGMFVVFQKGYPQGISCNKQTAEAYGINEGDIFIVQPYLQIQNVDKSHSMWIPSINDCLAEDWMIVE